MAGTIKIAPDDYWTSAGWFFDWIVESIAELTPDGPLRKSLREIDEYHLGWLSLNDFGAADRELLIDIIATQLPVAAARHFSSEWPGRADTLAHLADLSSRVAEAR